VAVPKATFNKSSDWTSYASDTCGGIGNKQVSSTKDTNSIISEFDFKLYPNPSNGIFSIEMENVKKYSIEIYSTLGKVVYSKNDNSESTLNINHLQTGIYLIKITMDSNTKTKRIIIN
jgi:uncharacterized membrane protein